jgi:hypothetical protein
MKHIASAVAIAAASLMIASTASAAGNYAASVYTPPPFQPNPWSLASSTNVDPLPSSGQYAGDIRYTLSNAVTGETRSFTLRTPTPVTWVSVNRLGEALLSTTTPSSAGEVYLYRDGTVSSFSSGAVSGIGWNDDGSINQNTYSGGSYRDMRFEYGKWFAVSGFGAPGGSAVKDVNASGMAVGDTRFMGFKTWSTAVRALNNGDAVRLDKLPSPFGAATWANSINDAGWILGSQTDYASASYTPCCGMPWGEYTMSTNSRALIWDPDGHVFDLNGWLDDGSAAQVHLDVGIRFLADGSMLATGYALSDPSKALTFRLSAVPEAQTWAMMGLGLVGIAAVAARRRILPFVLAA